MDHSHAPPEIARRGSAIKNLILLEFIVAIFFVSAVQVVKEARPGVTWDVIFCFGGSYMAIMLSIDEENYDCDCCCCFNCICVCVFSSDHCEIMMLYEMFDRIKDGSSLRATLEILDQNSSPVVQVEI